MSKFFAFTFFLAAVFSPSGLTRLQASAVDVYLSAPFTQNAADDGLNTGGGLANTTTETFNAPTFSTGKFTSFNSAAVPGVTYTSSTGNSTISAAGQYGGGGQDQYVGVANGDSVTLTFATPVDYFGLLWSAVDSGNSLQVFDQNNQIIGTFNATTFSSILPRNSTSQITAINGTKYNTIDYYGQPTGSAATTTTLSNRLNNKEQYAYLNFITEPGTDIKKIVIEETGAIFETDNHAVITSRPTALGDFVALTTVPEPSVVVTILAGLGALVFVGRPRRV